jgi:hypothetical protein
MMDGTRRVGGGCTAFGGWFRTGWEVVRRADPTEYRFRHCQQFAAKELRITAQGCSTPLYAEGVTPHSPGLPVLRLPWVTAKQDRSAPQRLNKPAVSRFVQPLRGR